MSVLSGVNQLLRLVFGSVLFVVVVLTAVISWVFVLEPFILTLGTTHPALPGTPGSEATLISYGLIGLVFIIPLWYIAAPIRNDSRQEVR